MSGVGGEGQKGVMCRSKVKIEVQPWSCNSFCDVTILETSVYVIFLKFLKYWDAK